MSRALCGSLCLAVALALPCLGEARAADGAATPEGVFDAFKNAMKDKDFKTGFAQTTPDSQELMLGGMAMGLSFMPALDPSKGAEAQKILDKHGIKKPDLSNPAALQQDPKAAMKQMVADVKDKPAAIADVMQFMEMNAGPNEQQDAASKADVLAGATLTDVKITGDSATGTVQLNAGGQSQSQPMKFKKVGQMWFIDFAALADEAMQGQGGTTPGQ